MGTTLPERQRWLEKALQGLAFWIGHRQSLFSSYPLTEGALIGEACNLMQANLPHDLVLLPEIMYRHLVPIARSIEGVTGQSRADLVLCDRGADRVERNGNVSGLVRFVIEVKRGSAPNSEIDSDLRRLHNYLKSAVPQARALLLVVAESGAPARFVKSGKSYLGKHAIPGTTGHFRVRRTVKAAASFSGRETAHYVSLIEVFLKDSGKAGVV